MSDYRTLYKQTCYAEPSRTYDEGADEPMIVFYMDGDTDDIVLTENDLENMLILLRAAQEQDAQAAAFAAHPFTRALSSAAEGVSGEDLLNIADTAIGRRIILGEDEEESE